ncbi:MAG: hypothetical protein OEZ38_08260 [Gammaproteobacteria bacterium]|nr:hypothetical protein [Gammaproteobacteria bacterium]
MRYLLICFSILLVLITGCDRYPEKNNSVYIVIDGYNDYKDKVDSTLKFMLTHLRPEDSLVVSWVGNGTSNGEDVDIYMTFDSRPSRANAEKRVFNKRFNELISSNIKSNHKDITGSLLRAIQYLNNKKEDFKYIIVFSDLDQGSVSGDFRNFPIILNKIQVIVSDVSGQLSGEEAKNRYNNRVDDWKKRIISGGGTWLLEDDFESLGKIIK